MRSAGRGMIYSRFPDRLCMPKRSGSQDGTRWSRKGENKDDEVERLAMRAGQTATRGG